MGIEDMIDEVVSEKKKEIEDKFDEISVINMAAGILLQRLLRKSFQRQPMHTMM